MFRCRLIRTVVNLSLIVAMIMQPGMALTFANDCGACCASTFLCEDCGCCEVPSPEVKCCCCGGGSKEELAVSCCTGSSESSLVEQSIPEHDEVTSGCHCGFRSQPLGDSSPVRRTIEQRNSVAIGFADLATTLGDAVPRTPRVVGSGDVSSPPHFSQIQLCIWRL